MFKQNSPASLHQPYIKRPLRLDNAYRTQADINVLICTMCLLFSFSYPSFSFFYTLPRPHSKPVTSGAAAASAIRQVQFQIVCCSYIRMYIRLNTKNLLAKACRWFCDDTILYNLSMPSTYPSTLSFADMSWWLQFTNWQVNYFPPQISILPILISLQNQPSAVIADKERVTLPKKHAGTRNRWIFRRK